MHFLLISTTSIHYRSRFAPSLWSGSTTKTSHRDLFSAQDDTLREALHNSAGSITSRRCHSECSGAKSNCEAAPSAESRRLRVTRRRFISQNFVVFREDDIFPYNRYVFGTLVVGKAISLPPQTITTISLSSALCQPKFFLVGKFLPTFFQKATINP